MNKYTLIFHNNATEANYQKQQCEMMFSKLMRVTNLIMITEVAAILTLTINQQFVELVISIMFGLPIIVIAYFIKQKPEYKKYVPLLFKLISLGCSAGPWIKYIMVGISPYDMVLSDICTLGSLCYITEINFKQNCFSYFFFVYARSSMHYILEGYTPYNVMYVIFSFILIFNDYYRILAQKQYYLMTQENMLQNQIIDVFSKEKILITQFDNESFSFKTILINQQLKQMMKQYELDRILQQVMLKQQKSSLEQFLYNYDQQIQENHYQSEQHLFSLIGQTKNNKRIKINIMVQRFVEKLYIIKFEYLNYAIQRNSAVLYTKFIKKILQESQSQKINILVNMEMIKNLIINASRDYKIKLIPKIIQIDFYRVFHDLGLKICQIQYKSPRIFHSDPLIVSSIVYLLSRVCKIQFMLIDFRNDHYIISFQGLKLIKLAQTNHYYAQALKTLRNYIEIEDIIFTEIQIHLQIDIHFKKTHE
ncbi:hypothetical protein pb186bvf_014430 [Paramecium bursaria]